MASEDWRWAVGALGAVVTVVLASLRWLVGLRSDVQNVRDRVSEIEKREKECRCRRDELEGKLFEKLEAVGNDVAEIKGYLDRPRKRAVKGNDRAN